LLGHPIEPHKNRRNKGFKTDNIQLVIGAEFCCECNLCSFYSCPEDLDPKNVSTDLKQMIMQKAENRLKFSPGQVSAHPMIKYRKAPLPKLIQKLGLQKYQNVAPLLPEPVMTDLVRIALKQHIGAPCQPKVKTGDTVQKGQLIATPGEKQLGANIHASINGVVTNINETFIEIKGQ
jgi:Na+-translocating ferredoxin:NAD+ oxidoreductase RnfC subunit